MTSTPPAASGSACVRLDGELTIYRAAELKPVLMAPFSQDQRVEIDLSGVTEIDTAGVQLLLMAQRHASALQRELCLSNLSPAVREVFGLLDLAPHFADLQ
jgi:anti-anti-sigma factor